MSLPEIVEPGGTPRFLVVGHGIDEGDVYADVPAATGAGRKRRVSTVQERRATVAKSLSPAQMAAYDDWFERTLVVGTLPWSVQLPNRGSGTLWWSARWAAPYRAEPRRTSEGITWVLTGELVLSGAGSASPPASSSLGLELGLDILAIGALLLSGAIAVEFGLSVAVPAATTMLAVELGLDVTTPTVTMLGAEMGLDVVASGGIAGGGGAGTVTSVSVVTASGLAGTVGTPTTTPAITITTTVTGLLKGNGSAISAAAAGTDYQAPIALTTTGTSGAATFSAGTLNIPNYATGSGTVTAVSVVSANGFSGTVATATTTPAITIATSVTGILKGSGAAISAAAAGTDYQAPITLTTTGTGGAATFAAGTLNIPNYAGGGITALTGDVTASGTGSVATTLATVNTNVGTFGDATHVAQITVNAKGLITAASAVSVSGGGGASGINLVIASGVYTAVLTDASVVEVQFNNAAANSLQIPLHATVAFPVGAAIGVRMLGVGQTSVSGVSGVTINSLGNLNLQSTGALAVVIQTATDIWQLTGELQPFVTYKTTQALDPANSTTAGTTVGIVITSSATVSHPAQALTNMLTAIRRIRWATATTAASNSGWFETTATKAQGSSGIGGYTCVFRFGISVNTTGDQAFIGIGPAAALAGDASALINMVGMGFDAADASSGNWQLMHNDASGTATKVDLGTGAARNLTDLYKLTLRAPSTGAVIFVTIVNESNSVTVLDTSYATDIPANTVFIAARAQIRNGALTAAMQLDFVHFDAGMQE